MRTNTCACCCSHTHAHAHALICTCLCKQEPALGATAFVNFANANFGYGMIIPSATQEEILQVSK